MESRHARRLIHEVIGAMKLSSYQLSKGANFRAQVIESLSEGFYILSFYGDLVRVRVEGALQLNPLEFINVKVVSTSPLVFQTISKDGSAQPQKSKKLNLSV